MALVRCPKHHIPYNDENPRGCPACAQEREGSEQANVMRDLARASQAMRRPGAVDTAAAPPPKPAEPAEPVYEEVVEFLETSSEPTPFDRLRAFIRRWPVRAIGLPLIVALGAVAVIRSRPRLLEQPHPPEPAGEVLPLPIEPGEPITTAFAVLGVQPPRAHPESRALERYSYGTDLAIDALNRVIYVIHLSVPNRSWRGLRVGLSQQVTEGTLALLGARQDLNVPAGARPDTLAGYVVYPSLEARPRRSHRVEVRPPNGCLDVVVDLQPRAVGLVMKDDLQYAAVGREGGEPEWVITRIMVLYRGMAGPLAPAAC